MGVILRAMLLAITGGVLASAQWHPDIVWSRDLGEGYAGFAVAADRIVTMYRSGGDEVIVALDRATGQTIWEHAYGAAALKDQDLSQGSGPHATPRIAGDMVCAAGVTGRLTCLDLASGRERWRAELITGLGGNVVYRGYSSTPVHHRDSIVAAVGGHGHALVAFDAATGGERWRAGSLANANSSPLLITVAGRSQVVGFMVDAVAGFDADSGRQLWTHPHPQQYDDNITPPLWFSDERLLIVSSALDGGTRALEVGGDSVRELWHQPRLGTYYTNLLAAGPVLAGSSGGAATSIYTAIDKRTGAQLWQSRDVKRANGVMLGARAILRDEEGAVIVARFDTTGVVVERRATLLEPGAPSPPAIAGSILYVRDRKRAMALNLGS